MTHEITSLIISLRGAFWHIAILTMHSSCVLLCVPFIFADNQSVDLAKAPDGFLSVQKSFAFSWDYRGAFQAVLLCNRLMKHNRYFSFQMTIDITKSS